MTYKNFHIKCDNKGENITFIKVDNGNIFGGYLSISWQCGNYYRSAPGSFLFTLINTYNTEPTKFPSKNDQKEAYFLTNCGPVFGGGHDLVVYLRNNNSYKDYSNFPFTYEDILGKGKSIFTGDLNIINII